MVPANSVASGEEESMPNSSEVGMPDRLDRANRFFELPLTLPSRVLLIAAAILLIPSFFFPLYQMTLYSNQFPDGLVLKIYSHTLEGGQTANRDDLREINTLNHYIGMRPLLESDFSEFKWLPFGIGAIVLLALRAVAIGKMSKLVDLVVLFVYFSLFSLWSFAHRLYQYGHVLDPSAAVKVKPFAPPVFGMQQIANFTVFNYPGLGAYLIAASVLLMVAALLLSARRKS
jgi:copper chaperone NosL